MIGELGSRTVIEAVRSATLRHEILRTTYPRVAGMALPLQKIAAEGAVRVTEHDLRGLDPGAQPAALRRVRRVSEARAYDPETGPLLDVVVCRLARHESVLLLGLPALSADGRALEELAREIVGGPGASSEENGDEGVEYADLAEWQNELLGSEETRSGREFWRQKDVDEAIWWSPPFEEKGAADAGFRPTRTAVGVGDAELEELRRLAEEADVSREALLHAGWQVVLSRWVGDDEPVIATAYDGRNYDELRGCLGLFARHLPVRLRVEAGASLPEMARSVDQTLEGLVPWQQYFSWADSERGAVCEVGGSARIRHPAVAFEHAERGRLDGGGGIRIQLREARARFDRYRVKLCSEVIDGSWRLELDSDRSRISRATAERLAESLSALIRSVAERPRAPLGSHAVLPERERRFLFVDFNDTARAFEGRSTVHEQSAVHARRRPEAPAVVAADGSLTYGDLERRANRLAHRLLARGVGRDERVGVCCGRTVTMVEAILGVMKCGAAYLPLDPSLPERRLRFMVEDAGASALVVDPVFAGRLPKDLQHGRSFLRLGESPDGTPGHDPEVEIFPECLAYLMYTSGSTGRPKGVGVEHRQLMSYTRGITAFLDLGPEDALATVSTFAADLGNTSIFAALVAGGCLHVISEEEIADPSAFADRLDAQPVDLLKIVPSHLEALLRSPRAPELLPRRWLISGGEAPRPELLERIGELRPSCRIVNHYGPTETTVGALVHDLGRLEGPGAEPPPLGRPLPNVRAYVLDAGGGEIPAGVAGELCIGGSGLARGYHGNPARTAERFVPDPFADLPGARMYRTGDRARLAPGGAIEFLGRLDDQVKIRGFRIELGEVEAAIRDQPGVREAAAAMREDAAGTPKLVAYLVPERGRAPSAGELRQMLTDRLPEMMVPGRFVILERLPLNANGKLDRRALPEPEAERPEIGAAYIAPETPLQETIAALWREVLGLERVGIDDNFFDLGGHSLLLMEVGTELRRRLGKEIPIIRLFRHPTIGALAAAFDGAAPDGADDREAEERGKSRRELLLRQRRARERTQPEVGGGE